MAGRTKPKKNKFSKKKGFRKYFTSTKHRKKDIDQIQDELRGEAEKLAKGEELPAPEFDEDLPGGGQFYCKETGRYFQDKFSLEQHMKTKFYKKRVKTLKVDKQYTQDEANLGAGITKEVLPTVGRQQKMEIEES